MKDSAQPLIAEIRDKKDAAILILILVLFTIKGIWLIFLVPIWHLPEEEVQEGKEAQVSKKRKTEEISIRLSTLGENIEEIIGRNWPIWILLVLALLIAFYMTVVQACLLAWSGSSDIFSGAKGQCLFISIIPGALLLTLGVKALLPEKKPDAD